MKKAFDQTVRDIKREVNKKVLKVPGIEQKILDATSNEPWGPHGSLLADIAQATRNYHEYQIIMTAIWKRINDTGKNWRHVYKGLTVLEYLVGHGSERVIDETKEHAYQISTLSEFQYIDSSGRDQGSNVRRKAQSLVALVNDKERIQEVRQKASANRDKYRSAFSTGGMHRPSSYSSAGGGYGDRFDDDRYGSREEDRNGYGRERDGGYRDDERYGRSADPYGQDGYRYGRDSDERYGRDGYKDDDYRGSRGHDDFQLGSRNRSIERDRDRSYEDDDRYSSRSGGGRGDDPSHDERRLERKLSEQSVGAPPSYEEAIRDAQNHIQQQRDVETVPAPAPKASSPPAAKVSSPSERLSQGQSPVAVGGTAPPSNKEVDAFDEFDPRGSSSASAGMDLFESLSAADHVNSLALVPVTSMGTTSEADIPNNSDFGANFVALSSASTVLNQPADDPFGDSPFKAIPQDNNIPAQPQNFAPVTSFQAPSGLVANFEPHPPVAPKTDAASGFDFGNSFQGITYAPPSASNSQPLSTTTGFLPPELQFTQPNTGVPGNFLLQTGSATAMPSQVFQPAAFQPATSAVAQSSPNILYQSGLSALPASQASPSYPLSQPGLSAPPAPQAVPLHLSQPGLSTPLASQSVPQPFSQPGLSVPQSSPAVPMNLLSQTGFSAPPPSQPAKAPQVDKFETKSTVWSDTLSRGLVNLNISGPKTNPLADIGIDFDSINRMEKRKEKEKSSASTVSTVTMGKAMGSGSGIGRAGASGIAPPPNSMMGSGMGMGIGVGMAMGSGGGMGMGIGMGGYGGGMNQPMGMGMNMGMGPGAPFRPPTGMPPASGMPGVGYNPMMGMGGYGSQQQFGGGYR